MVRYAAPTMSPELRFFVGVQSHSGEWLKHRSAKKRVFTPPLPLPYFHSHDPGFHFSLFLVWCPELYRLCSSVETLIYTCDNPFCACQTSLSTMSLSATTRHASQRVRRAKIQVEKITVYEIYVREIRSVSSVEALGIRPFRVRISRSARCFITRFISVRRISRGATVNDFRPRIFRDRRAAP